MAPNPSAAKAARIAALALVYFATARVGLRLGAVSGVATAIWPPSGIALAALLILGGQVWPGIALGAFAANVSIGVPWPGALAICAGNTLEAVIGAALLERAASCRRELDRLRDVIALVVLAALASTVVSATVGATSGRLTGVVGAGEFLRTWKAWWLGDAMGMLVAAPLLMTWSAGRGADAPARSALEAAAVFGALSALSLGIFVEQPAAGLLRPYFLFPLLMWAALRFGPRGAATGDALVTVIAVVGITRGYGPFVRSTLAQSLLTFQVFMAVAAVTALTVAAVGAERDRAVRRTLLLNAELERRVADRTAQLAGANAELEAFSYSIAHDLRAPLRSIHGFSMVLQKRWTAASPEDAAHFQRIHDAIGRMGSLIDGLLQLSGVTHAAMRREPVDLGALARRAAEDLVRADPSRRASFSIADGLVVAGDPALLGVLIWNLLENAWKFTRGQPEARIEFAQAGVSTAPVFVVRDNGAGFDMAHAGKLFRPFQRLHGRSDFPGSGIGLAMVRRVVERHGGRAWAEGAPGRGAAFYFTFGPAGTERP